MIGRIKDLNALDKDSLKHFSKLVHEFNALVATDVVIDRITPNIGEFVNFKLGIKSEILNTYFFKVSN